MSIYSTYWYRVAEIKPRLRHHVRLYRHIYRGSTWYILQDPSSGRQHRFNKNGYAIINLMDGNRTIQEIWDIAISTMGDDAPTQDGIIRLLGQLHVTDVLQSDILPDSAELLERQVKKPSTWKKRFSNPFSLRFPMLDPDPYLKKYINLAKPFVGRASFIVWVFVVAAACLLVLLNWPELTHNMADRVLQPQNLLLLWLVYPVVKLFHELAHAFVTKIWGGEVHEMGIILLVFTPLPYVEASSSAAFPEKSKRIGVAAAGMMMEMFLAALALFLWLNVEAGQVSAIAYNVMLVGGVSTILFNGNPLLRFDGYYVLQDFIEIPNLGKRSKNYLGHLLKKYAFGMEDSESPASDSGERIWLAGYGIISFFYRIFILAVLTLFVSSKFFVVGVGIAVWAIFSQMILPAVKNSYEVYNSISGQRKKKRIVLVTAATAGILGLMLFVVPAPYKTKVEGVVSLPEYSLVRAGTDCFVTEILVPNDAAVEKDDHLVRCEDHLLGAEVEVLEASLVETQTRYNGEPIRAQVQRDILKQEINTVKADLARARERVQDLIIESPNRGRLVLPQVNTLVGRFLTQGSLLGYIIGASDPNVVLVVEQPDISLVRLQTKGVELRLAGQLNKTIASSIKREIPAASNQLPSPVLGTSGGGKIPVNPSDTKGITALRKTFQFEVSLPLEKDDIRIGERVYALFDHGYEPLAMQWYRALRNLFLSRFHV